MNAHRPEGSETPLRQGLLLLEEQREAMLARDPDRLSAVHARLSDWLEALRAGARVPQAASALRGDDGAVGQVRAALDANAMLARRLTVRVARALEALVPTTRQTYCADGRASTALPRRETRSA